MKTIGILGGGQLGRMFIQNALNYPYNIHILDPDREAPCAGIAHEFWVGKLTDFETVYQFGKTVDVLTIEIENVNVDALDRLVAEGKTVYPQPHIIRLIQDKRAQKLFLKRLQIPTADFVLIDSPEALPAHAEFLPAFQKLAVGGYDGKGVKRLHTSADFAQAFTEPSLLEKAVDMRTEIAVMVARNPSGEIAVYPAVEMVFDHALNLIDYQCAPYMLQPHEQATVEGIARKIVENLDFVGVLAIEFFVTKEGEFLVNEMAPRPHNSGHQTIEGNICSQFDQHLRAIMDLPLGSTASRGYALMYNLIGEEDGTVVYVGLEAVLGRQGVYLHLYGKTHTRIGRKMGHITLIADTMAELEESLAFLKQNVRVISIESMRAF